MDRLRRRQVFGPDGYPVAGAVIALDAPVETHTHDFLELAVLVAGRVTYASDTGRLSAGGRRGDGGATGRLARVRRPARCGDRQPLPRRGAAAHRAALAARGRRSRPLPAARRAGRPAPRRPWPDGGAEPGSPSWRTCTPSRPERARCWRSDCAVRPWPSSVRLRLDDDRRPAFSLPVRQLLLLVSRRPAHPWTMAELAAEVGLSVSHLHREFRSQLGITPMAWLASDPGRARRLAAAADRPAGGWVGAQVGWPDPNYFSRCFRRAYGISPSTYRQRNSHPADAPSPPTPPLRRGREH